MSDVRLSNASPTLERGVDARQQDNLRPPVRRNLFGRPDPAEIQRNLDAVVREDVQVLRERYNFDPVSDRPLSPLNYEWQEDRDAPEFYRRPPHVNQPPQRDGDLADRTPQQDAAEEASGRRSGQERQSSRKRRLGPSGD
uniref:Cyclin-dependent kinase inhibitor 1B n=1 Tax=Echeneis naucrates TaxID=173247 RepID=A0A665WKJ1_ECHNA